MALCDRCPLCSFIVRFTIELSLPKYVTNSQDYLSGKYRVLGAHVCHPSCALWVGKVVFRCLEPTARYDNLARVVPRLLKVLFLLIGDRRLSESQDIVFESLRSLQYRRIESLSLPS